MEVSASSLKSAKLSKALRSIVMGVVLASTTPAAAEPQGSPHTCHIYPWYDMMNWWFGIAGVCYYPAGGTQHFDDQGNYW